MKAPFPIHELDRVLAACIDFTDHHEPYFYWAQIADRCGMTDRGDEVQRMIAWLARLDDGLLEDCGHAKDNIRYFRLGVDARRVMSTGGLGPYFQTRSRTESLERVRLWSPVGISIVAVIVSLFALNKPAANSPEVRRLRAQVTELRREQGQLEAAITRLAAAPGSTPHDDRAPPAKGAASPGQIL